MARADDAGGGAQGGRLTAYELARENIPYTLICDNMAAVLMRQGRIQRVFVRLARAARVEPSHEARTHTRAHAQVGADRIARNGDFANKIGTYSVAVAAAHHGVPMHAVAPATTFDARCATGADIEIEQRTAAEARTHNVDG